MNVEDQVKDIIAKNLNVARDKVKDEAVLQTDLGADSLDIVELLMHLEDNFGMKISDEVPENLKTVGDTIKYIAFALGVEVVVQSERAEGSCGAESLNSGGYIGSSDGRGPDWNAILNTRKQTLNAYPDIWICRDGSGQKIYGPFLSRSEAADCWMDLDSPVVMHMPDGSRVEISKSEMHVPGEGF